MKYYVGIIEDNRIRQKFIYIANNMHNSWGLLQGYIVCRNIEDARVFSEQEKEKIIKDNKDLYDAGILFFNETWQNKHKGIFFIVTEIDSYFSYLNKKGKRIDKI